MPAITHGEQELLEHPLNALVRFEHQSRVLDAILEDRVSSSKGLLELILEQRCCPSAVRGTIRPISDNDGGFFLPRLHQERIKLFPDDKVADPVFEVAHLGAAEGREVEERLDREVRRGKESGGSRDAVGVDDPRGRLGLVLGLVALVEDDGLGASRGRPAAITSQCRRI